MNYKGDHYHGWIIKVIKHGFAKTTQVFIAGWSLGQRPNQQSPPHRRSCSCSGTRPGRWGPWQVNGYRQRQGSMGNAINKNGGGSEDQVDDSWTSGISSKSIVLVPDFPSPDSLYLFARDYIQIYYNHLYLLVYHRTRSLWLELQHQLQLGMTGLVRFPLGYDHGMIYWRFLRDVRIFEGTRGTSTSGPTWK